MFESFYGLQKTPFSRDIPTDQLYQSHLLEETLGRLEYTAQRQMFAVLTGDCGTGKWLFHINSSTNFHFWAAAIPT